MPICTEDFFIPVWSSDDSPKWILTSYVTPIWAESPSSPLIKTELGADWGKLKAKGLAPSPSFWISLVCKKSKKKFNKVKKQN